MRGRERGRIWGRVRIWGRGGMVFLRGRRRFLRIWHQRQNHYDGQRCRLRFGLGHREGWLCKYLKVLLHKLAHLFFFLCLFAHYVDFFSYKKLRKWPVIWDARTTGRKQFKAGLSSNFIFVPKRDWFYDYFKTGLSSVLAMQYKDWAISLFLPVALFFSMNWKNSC